MSSPTRSGDPKKQPRSESPEGKEVRRELKPFTPVPDAIVKSLWSNKRLPHTERLFFWLAEKSWGQNQLDAVVVKQKPGTGTWEIEGFVRLKEAEKPLGISRSEIYRAAGKLKEEGRLEKTAAGALRLSVGPMRQAGPAPVADTEALRRITFDREMTRAEHNFPENGASRLDLDWRLKTASPAEISRAGMRLDGIAKGAIVMKNSVDGRLETDPNYDGEQKVKGDRFVHFYNNDEIDKSSQNRAEDSANAPAPRVDPRKSPAQQFAALATKIFRARFNKDCDLKIAAETLRMLGDKNWNRFLHFAANATPSISSYGAFTSYLAGQFADVPGWEKETESSSDAGSRKEAERLVQSMKEHSGDRHGW